ncbi:hypothetical protein Tco_0685224 [Tanacetum coccineum]
MTSFDYRLNPIYAIKECSSCGSLYTSNCGCSKGNLEDKTLVPKPLRYCARCARCGTPVDGPYCQGCALLRKKFKEDVFAYCVENFQDFQDTSESSDDIPSSYGNKWQPYVKWLIKCYTKKEEEKRIAEEQAAKIDIGRFPFATMMTKKHHCNHTRFTNRGEITSKYGGYEALETIPETESDEFIKSSVEDLVPIPSEPEGIPDQYV